MYAMLKMDQEITGRETKACLNVVWKAVGLILCLEGVREVSLRTFISVWK